jgi:hypothetical protein
MPMINDKGFTKMWHDLKKDAGISSSPWYKKADAAVSKFVEAYQKTRKKAGEPDEALTEDILKVIESLDALGGSLDKFMDAKGLNDVKDAPPEKKQNILKGIRTFRKEVDDEKEFYNVELQDRIGKAGGDVKKVLAEDAQRKLGNWQKSGAVDLKGKAKEETTAPTEPGEKIKKGEVPPSLDYAWWRARKPKDLQEDPKLKVTMDYFWDHYTMYKEANPAVTDNKLMTERINCLRQMTPGLNQSEQAVQKTIANCDNVRHANSKAALQHYLKLIHAYRLQRKQFVTQEKTRTGQIPGLQAVLDEKLKGDPDY